MVRHAFTLHHNGALWLGDVSCWRPMIGRCGRFGDGFGWHGLICTVVGLLARLLQILEQ